LSAKGAKMRKPGGIASGLGSQDSKALKERHEIFPIVSGSSYFALSALKKCARISWGAAPGSYIFAPLALQTNLTGSLEERQVSAHVP
jgi:hypothetical protein